ncbi:hypothetical protein E2C01_031320 [Portunus trituberculatus]|uniref:Uncharacterized protein n=1 Tax=Portunus trituberculatus TaxID=210409 RepID=A0A5B7EXA6_PORTR|nr:hypothetical protein [Portunus trituberculatus]
MKKQCRRRRDLHLQKMGVMWPFLPDMDLTHHFYSYTCTRDIIPSVTCNNVGQVSQPHVLSEGRGVRPLIGALRNGSALSPLFPCS